MTLPQGDLELGATQLAYIGIGVSDLAAWRDFAIDTLGMQEATGGADDGLLLRLDEYHHRFVLTPTGEDDIVFAGWEVASRQALDAVCRRAAIADLEVTVCSPEEAQAHRVREMVKFKDPDGLEIHVFYGPLLDHEPFRSSRIGGGFRAGQRGFGHVVMDVASVERTRDFYQSILRLRVTDCITRMRRGELRDVTFMRANVRHHSMALGNRSTRALSARRMAHFMVQANSLDDVGLTLSHCEQKGLQPAQLGRHTNDRMLSFYVPTPSGFAIEFGCDGVEIEDERGWTVKQYASTSVWGHGPALAPATAR